MKSIPFNGLLREVKDRINHFYLQTDGTFDFPNNKEGDLLKMINKALSSDDPND